ncbi:MAG TPA: SIP domain-containing protein [Microbacteriaceae bacterium]|nr:SIP domain-containing protein [Microbacteriaceae bacterium]
MTPRHHGPSEQVLIAGDEDDLPAIHHLLWLLPEDVYGHVFIETLTEDGRTPLAAPERVSVTWLPRAARRSRLRSLVFADRGEPLAAALVGWAAEWLDGGCGQLADRHLLWVGAAGSGNVAATRDLVLEALCGHVYALGEAGGVRGTIPWAKGAPNTAA